MRSLGEDATLGDILQTLNEQYCVVMTFDTLSKELSSLRQETGENVDEFGVCLSQQLQIIKTEYPGHLAFVFFSTTALRMAWQPPWPSGLCLPLYYSLEDGMTTFLQGFPKSFYLH